MPRGTLPRKTVWMDDRGRITLPVALRKKIEGLKGEGWVVAELYPDAENPKSMNIRPQTP